MDIKQLETNLMLKANTLTDESDIALFKELHRLITEYETMNNELCLKCGNYKTSYLGSCDGCRWKV